MVLAGYSPEIIMDACSRALSFWSYQMAQQSSCMETSVERSRQRAAQLEQAVERTTRECRALKEHLQVAERENAKLRQYNEELRDQLERRFGAANVGGCARVPPASAATTSTGQTPDPAHLDAIFATDDQEYASRKTDQAAMLRSSMKIQPLFDTMMTLRIKNFV
ncbi:hypothetical protein HPB52_003811 [Rhipicephalus sanguineus]|uniref:Uncharacterized protein n=1 Tax=Rhipicephalus sanguineus TaxID=34632 RepID=A0A9D4Q4G6_RHISA|nr:hypothetical protein HPB52_003811 [Rhipicephalus sanguineus]